jgi:nitrogen fixation/metabolism regulation signal transduction histidine kinase
MVARSVIRPIELVIDSAARVAVGDLSQQEGDSTVLASGELGRLVSERLRRLVSRWRLPEDESDESSASQRRAA